MLLYDGDTNLVIGQWLNVLEGGGKYRFEFKDSWLKGADENRKVKGFDSLEDGLFSLVCFIFAVIGIVNAANGKAKGLPIVGKFRILK